MEKKSGINTEKGGMENDEGYEWLKKYPKSSKATSESEYSIRTMESIYILQKYFFIIPCCSLYQWLAEECLLAEA